MWESTGGSIPLSSRRVRAKRSREGVPAFCMITFCTIHICTIGCYEWASVVCRKAQVVQSLCPYIHGVSSLVETLYGIWILARVLGQSPFPRGKTRLEGGIVFVERHEHADAPHAVALLRARRERPSSRAAERSDEIHAVEGKCSSGPPVLARGSSRRPRVNR